MQHRILLKTITSTLTCREFWFFTIKANHWEKSKNRWHSFQKKKLRCSKTFTNWQLWRYDNEIKAMTDLNSTWSNSLKSPWRIRRCSILASEVFMDRRNSASAKANDWYVWHTSSLFLWQHSSWKCWNIGNLNFRGNLFQGFHLNQE